MPGKKYASQAPKSRKVAEYIINTFPTCWETFITGASYPDISLELQNKDNDPLTRVLPSYAIYTITRSLNASYFGFDDGSICIPGIFKNAKKDPNEMIQLRIANQSLEDRLHAVTGYEKWTAEQTNKLIELYNSGKTPTQIADEIDIEGKTKIAVITKIEDLQKRNILTSTNIKWEGEFAKRAIDLIASYSSRNLPVPNTQIATQLNEEFYKGKKIITSQKLNNFRRRLEQ